MLQCWFETLSWHHFDVTCKHCPISLHYEHQNVIILISLISAIVNITWTSFWCLYPTVLITSLRHHCYVGSWFETSSWHHFDVTYQHPRWHQNMIILMSLITDFTNVFKISYWCLYTTVIMNIVLTSFWCNIPILAYMNTEWTSKFDHFDVTHNCDCQRQWNIILMSLFSCDYKHPFDIILMLHTKTRLYKCIRNIKMWSFWRHFTTYRH